MIVIFKADTLEVEHCVHVAADDFVASIQQDPLRGMALYDQDYGPEYMTIMMVDGVPTAFLKVAFDLPSSLTAVAGEEIAISGVPEGTHISGDAGYCVMDATGLLEVTFAHAGPYRLSFSHSQYLHKEISVEVAA